MTYTESEIRDSIERVNNWIIKNSTTPKTVRVKKDTLTWAEYLKLPHMQNAKKNIQEFKKKNGRYPNYVTIVGYRVTKVIYDKIFSFTPTPSKPKWLDPPKCGQDTPYYCACASLQQCFYHLTGKVVAESSIAKVAGTTSAGTDHKGINTAVAWFNKKYGYNLKVKWYNFSDLGSWTNVNKEMTAPNQAVFFHLKYANGGQCQNECKFGHYESARSINLKANSITVNNSLGKKSGSGYVGEVQTRSLTCQKKMMSLISQPSICVIAK